jgi:hypothetical protein
MLIKNERVSATNQSLQSNKDDSDSSDSVHWFDWLNWFEFESCYVTLCQVFPKPQIRVVVVNLLNLL